MTFTRVNVSSVCTCVCVCACIRLQCSTKRGWGGVRANAGVTQCVCNSQPYLSVNRGVQGLGEVVFVGK